MNRPERSYSVELLLCLHPTITVTEALYQSVQHLRDDDLPAAAAWAKVAEIRSQAMAAATTAHKVA